MICRLTLEGSIHSSTINKVARALIGHVNRAELSGCTGGSATVLTEALPWHITYEGFRGTLPSIERLNVALLNVSFRIAPRESPTCLMRSTAESPVRSSLPRNSMGNVLTNLVFEEFAPIPLTGEFLCPLVERQHLSGSGTFTEPGVPIPRIRLQLI